MLSMLCFRGRLLILRYVLVSFLDLCYSSSTSIFPMEELCRHTAAPYEHLLVLYTLAIYLIARDGVVRRLTTRPEVIQLPQELK